MVRLTDLVSRNAVQPPAPLRGDSRDIYLGLHGAVAMALGGVLDKARITAAVGRVVDAFLEDPWHDLLLLHYSFSRKNYLLAHISNDVILSIGFGRALGFNREDLLELGLCAFCHDLGMAGLEALSGKGQSLLPQEIEDIKQHPLRSAELIRPLCSDRVVQAVLAVHERENGQGYPMGIPGAEIPLMARIVAVCDTFEALTHPRVFRPAYSPYEAMKMVIRKKDVLFEDTVVRRFIDFLSIYPVGSLVELNGGETVLVVRSNPGSPTRPVVRVVLTEKHEIDNQSPPVDLVARDFVYITGVVSPDREKELLYFLKPRGQVELDEA